MARLGAVALGEVDGPDAYARWLHRLVADSADFRTSPLVSPRDVLQGVGDLSARYCRQLAVHAEIRARRPPARAARAFPQRAAWLKSKLAVRGDTAHYFAALSGIEPRTVKKILAGSTVREEVLIKLAAALACAAHEIPAD